MNQMEPKLTPLQEEQERIRQDLENTKPEAESPVEEERVPEHSIAPENPSKTPNEVIDEEKLAA